MEEEYIHATGHIIYLNFDPQIGHEQRGRRPALVLTPFEYNSKTSLAIMCPITNSEKGYPFEVKIPPDFDVTGVILCDQVKSLDWRERNAEYKCELPPDIVFDVLEKIKVLLFEE